MRDHAVLGANAHVFDVPEAHEALHRLDAREAAVVSERVRQSFCKKSVLRPRNFQRVGRSFFSTADTTKPITRSAAMVSHSQDEHAFFLS